MDSNIDLIIYYDNNKYIKHETIIPLLIHTILFKANQFTN